MCVSYQKRIHIAPQGYEDDRIAEAAIKMKADKVILITHDDRTERARECRSNIETRLDDSGVNCDVREADIFDLDNAVETILDAIRDQQPNSNIRVNISAGSKITAVAGTLACMMSDADPYYVSPEEYSDRETESPAMSRGVNDIESVPAYPITKLDQELVDVLSFIAEEQDDKGHEGVILKKINTFLLRANHPAVHGSDAGPDEPEKVYQQVNDNVITPLESKGLIETQRIGNGKHVYLTEQAKQLLSFSEAISN